MTWLVNEGGKLIQLVTELSGLPEQERIRLAERGLLPSIDWRVEWHRVLSDHSERMWITAWRGPNEERVVGVVGFVYENTMYLEMLFNTDARLLLSRPRPNLNFYKMMYADGTDPNQIKSVSVPLEEYELLLNITGLVTRTAIELAHNQPDIRLF